MKFIKWLLGTDDGVTKTIHFRPDDVRWGNWKLYKSNYRFTGRVINGKFQTVPTRGAR